MYVAIRVQISQFPHTNLVTICCRWFPARKFEFELKSLTRELLKLTKSCRNKRSATNSFPPAGLVIRELLVSLFLFDVCFNE